MNFKHRAFITKYKHMLNIPYLIALLFRKYLTLIVSHYSKIVTFTKKRGNL